MSQLESNRDYIITTKSGCIPYIINDSEVYFNKPRKIYLDDFLCKDSFYDKKFSEKIEKYLGIDVPVLVGFKNTPKILISKKGHYKLTEDRYKEVIGQMQAKFYFDFSSGKLIFNDKEVYEPKNLDDFNNGNQEMVGTQFINDLIDQAILIYEENGILMCKHLNETDLEYQKYLLSINEMNAFAYISDHNYRIFYDFMNKPSKPE